MSTAIIAKVVKARSTNDGLDEVQDSEVGD